MALAALELRCASLDCLLRGLQALDKDEFEQSITNDLEFVLKDARDWLDKNPLAEEDACEGKLKTLRDVAKPIETYLWKRRPEVFIMALANDEWL